MAKTTDAMKIIDNLIGDEYVLRFVNRFFQS